MSALTVFLVIFTAQSAVILADDPCRFHTFKGLIDLTSIGRNDGKAAFEDKLPPDPSQYRYSYNPCRPFSEGSACVNVAACQISSDGAFTYSLGTHDTVTWDDGTILGIDPTVSYKYGARTVRVTLECGSSETDYFEVIGETSVNTFQFRLKSKCACWDGCQYSPETSTEAPYTTDEVTNATITTVSTTTTTHAPTTTTSKTTSTPSTASDRNILSRGVVLLAIVGLVYSTVFHA